MKSALFESLVTAANSSKGILFSNKTYTWNQVIFLAQIFRGNELRNLSDCRCTLKSNAQAGGPCFASDSPPYGVKVASNAQALLQGDGALKSDRDINHSRLHSQHNEC